MLPSARPRRDCSSFRSSMETRQSRARPWRYELTDAAAVVALLAVAMPVVGDDGVRGGVTLITRAGKLVSIGHGIELFRVLRLLEIERRCCCVARYSIAGLSDDAPMVRGSFEPGMVCGAPLVTRTSFDSLPFSIFMSFDFSLVCFFFWEVEEKSGRLNRSRRLLLASFGFSILGDFGLVSAVFLLLAGTISRYWTFCSGSDSKTSSSNPNSGWSQAFSVVPWPHG